ncbi:MAG: hypothetical protein L0H53_08310 [Candidatus Nitrosocosmicus sp.]|nr:hypothetical protein [Candidatus Nitrosocosmicus sp.]
MKRNTGYEFFIISLTGFSVFLILFQYYYDPLGQALIALFIFDFIVSIILAVDFVVRIKSQNKDTNIF